MSRDLGDPPTSRMAVWKGMGDNYWAGRVRRVKDCPPWRAAGNKYDVTDDVRALVATAFSEGHEEGYRLGYSDALFAHMPECTEVRAQRPTSETTP